jgi:hypothetical protein
MARRRGADEAGDEVRGRTADAGRRLRIAGPEFARFDASAHGIKPEQEPDSSAGRRPVKPAAGGNGRFGPRPGDIGLARQGRTFVGVACPRLVYQGGNEATMRDNYATTALKLCQKRGV